MNEMRKLINLMEGAGPFTSPEQGLEDIQNISEQLDHYRYRLDSLRDELQGSGSEALTEAVRLLEYINDLLSQAAQEVAATHGVDYE